MLFSFLVLLPTRSAFSFSVPPSLLSCPAHRQIRSQRPAHRWHRCPCLADRQDCFMSNCPPDRLSMCGPPPDRALMSRSPSNVLSMSSYRCPAPHHVQRMDPRHHLHLHGATDTQRGLTHFVFEEKRVCYSWAKVKLARTNLKKDQQRKLEQLCCR